MICDISSGEVNMMYLDNKFPILLYTHDIPIRSLDINFTRKRLALIDDNYDIFLLLIYHQKELFGKVKNLNLYLLIVILII